MADKRLETVAVDDGRDDRSPHYSLVMESYRARDIAADLRRRIPGLPTKKLHKLLYYAQGHHLAVFGEPLFNETISAWDMGPVVGELWYAESQDGPAPQVDAIDEAAANTVGYIVSRYGRLSGNELERLTHGERPWQDADRERRTNVTRTQRIDRDDMTKFFRSDAEPDDAAELSPDPATVARWLAEAGTERSTQPSRDTAESLLARLT